MRAGPARLVEFVLDGSPAGGKFVVAGHVLRAAYAVGVCRDDREHVRQVCVLDFVAEKALSLLEKIDHFEHVSCRSSGVDSDGTKPALADR
jgi:hypothetical protein